MELRSFPEWDCSCEEFSAALTSRNGLDLYIGLFDVHDGHTDAVTIEGENFVTARAGGDEVTHHVIRPDPRLYHDPG